MTAAVTAGTLHKRHMRLWPVLHRTISADVRILSVDAAHCAAHVGHATPIHRAPCERLVWGGGGRGECERLRGWTRLQVQIISQGRPGDGGGHRSEETEIQGGMANHLGVRDGVKARTCLAMLRQRAERLADAVVPHAAAPTAEDASGCV